jgi:hypothetical protein
VMFFITRECIEHHWNQSNHTSNRDVPPFERLLCSQHPINQH